MGCIECTESMILFVQDDHNRKWVVSLSVPWILLLFSSFTEIKGLTIRHLLQQSCHVWVVEKEGHCSSNVLSALYRSHYHGWLVLRLSSTCAESSDHSFPLVDVWKSLLGYKDSSLVDHPFSYIKPALDGVAGSGLLFILSADISFPLSTFFLVVTSFL